MNETSLGFIDSLYLRFLGVPATEEQRLSLGFIMESEGLSVRETTIRFIEDNLKNSLFHEYYIQFPESSPSVDELIAWAESQGKNDAETSELVSLIAFDLFAINVNKTQGGVEFLSQPTIETVENQVDTGLQVGVDNNENITYSLVDTSFGVDRNLFNIDSDTGITSFKEAKNFESPEDSNKDNVYQITVAASNSLTKVDVFQNISITVSDDNDAPEIESGQSMENLENRTPSDTLITVAAIDKDKDSSIENFSIVSGNNQDFFEIDNQGNISLTSKGADSQANDFEVVENEYILAVVATDNKGLQSEPEEVSLFIADIEEREFSLTGIEEVIEGETAKYDIIMTGGDVSEDSIIELSLLVSSGSALENVDFNNDPNNNNLTISGPFSDGDVVASINVVTENDTLLESGEDFSVTLSAAMIDGNNVPVTTPESVSTTIVDNEAIEFTLTGDTAAIEGGIANYQITITGGDVSEDSIIVLSLSAIAGTALTPADFGLIDFGDSVEFDPTSNTLTLSGPFNDGDIITNISVGAVDDNLVESNENFAVTLNSATIDDNSATATGTVQTTIVDNEDVIFTLTGDSSVVEGAIANYQINMTGGDVSAGSTIVLSLSAIAGTALTPADFGLIDFGDSVEFDPTNNTLTLSGPFSDGEIVTNIRVGAVDDNLAEGNEDFTVILSSATIDANSATATGAVKTTIVDNEDVIFALTGDSSIIEGGTANYQISMTGGDVSEGSIIVLSLSATAGTALTPADFGQIDIIGDSVEFDPTNNTLTIIGPYNDGDIVASINVATVDDNLAEGNEDFTVALSSATIDANSATATGTVKTTIVDNEDVIFTLTGDSSIIEGGTANYQISMTGGDVSEGSIIVLSLSATAGTALTPADFGQIDIIGDSVEFDPTNNTLTIIGPYNDGDIVASINVATVDDNLAEGDEDFTLALISATIDTNSATATGTVQTTIVDNEDIVFTLTGDSSAIEGSTANYQITMTGGDVSASSTTVLSLSVLAGTALTPADFGQIDIVGNSVQFDPNNNTLTIIGPITDGDLVANINVATVDDKLAEGDEDFTLALSSATIDGNSASTTGTVKTTIVDNDAYSFNLTGDISVSEGGTASYSIVLTGADIQTGSTVELNLNTSNGAALLFSDFNDLNNANYNAATNTLSLTGPFSVGDTVASMTVDTIDDSLYEADEDFQLILSSGTVDGTTVDASDSISTTILDNETLAFTLSGTDGVSEGETASYAVVMTGGDLLSGDIVTLDLDALSGTAVSPADFSDLSGSGYDSLTNQLTINGNFISGDTVATLSIPTAFDVDVELEERFSVSLSGGTGVHGDISANNTVTTDISDVPVNIINVTGFSGTSFITGSFTPGIDKVVVDYGDARYFNAGNFDLSGFSDIDILSFNTLDGAVILSHKTHSFTSNLGRNFISSGNRLTTFTTTISSSHTFTFTSGLTSSQDKILYSGSSVKLSSSLAFSVGRSVNSIQISGLPDNLTAGNFEFI